MKIAQVVLIMDWINVPWGPWRKSQIDPVSKKKTLEYKIVLMEEILHQLRLVVHPIICRDFIHPTGGWPWDFWLPSVQYDGWPTVNKNLYTPKFEAYVFTKCCPKLRITLPEVYGLVVEPTHLKNMIVKLEIFPK